MKLGTALSLAAIAAGCAAQPGRSKALIPTSEPEGPLRSELVSETPSTSTVVAATDSMVRVMGRVERTEDGVRFGYPGVSLRLRFRGTALSARMNSTSNDSLMHVVVDGVERDALSLQTNAREYPLVEALDDDVHTVELVHRTETWRGIVSVNAFVLPPGGTVLEPEPERERKLLVIGDSVTCGEAVRRGTDCAKDSTWWDARASYGMVIGRALDAEVHLVCYGGRGLVRDWQGSTKTLNAPRFFELSVPEKNAPPWAHGAFVPDAIVVSLGTNDFNLALGPLPDEAWFISEYVAFVRRLLEVHPEARVLLTDGAIINDAADEQRAPKTTLQRYLASTVAEVADGRVSTFFASHQPGDDCDPHPTAEQHDAMARELAAALRRVLGW